jgi:hypothetical protein
MKKIFLLTFCLFFVGQAFSQRQRQRDSINNNYRREFMINPLSFFVGGFELGYTKISPDRIGTRLYAGYYFSENAGSYGDNNNTSSSSSSSTAVSANYKNMEGARLELQVFKMQPSKSDFLLYYGGYAVYKFINLDVSKTSNIGGATTTVDYKAKGAALGLGLILGMRNYVHDNIFLDIYAGGGLNLSLNHMYEDDVNISLVNPYKRSINPRAGISVGVSF